MRHTVEAWLPNPIQIIGSIVALEIEQGSAIEGEADSHDGDALAVDGGGLGVLKL